MSVVVYVLLSSPLTDPISGFSQMISLLPAFASIQSILYTADRCSRNVNQVGPFCCLKLCSDVSEQHFKLKPPPFHGLQDFMRSDSRWPHQPHVLHFPPELMGCAANRPGWPLCCSHRDHACSHRQASAFAVPSAWIALTPVST